MKKQAGENYFFQTFFNVSLAKGNAEICEVRLDANCAGSEAGFHGQGEFMRESGKTRIIRHISTPFPRIISKNLPEKRRRR